MKHTRASRVFFALALLLVPLIARADQHFYRSGPYYSEPRFNLEKMTGLDIMVQGGSTHHGRDANHNKVNALNIYGNYNMHKVGEGVSNLNPLNAGDAILLNLAAQPNNGTFGELSFSGKFNYVGGEATWTQNLWHGFFTQSVLPFGRRQVSNISYTDLSPETGLPNAGSFQWTQFLSNFDAILENFDLSKAAYSQTSFGDIESYIGWAYNCDSCKHIDFIDTTIRLGGSFFTSEYADIDYVYSLAQGYDGHSGFIGTFDMAVGAWEWFTAGFHVGGKVFDTIERTLRVKTDINQSGFIKLQEANVERKLGSIWDAGAYLKADHFAKGFSLMLGYTFQQQEATTLMPDDANYQTLSYAVVNSDAALQKWNMHQIQVNADYDFAKEGRWFNPHLALFYSVPVYGKRIFNTQMFGGVLGANMTWNF